MAKMIVMLCILASLTVMYCVPQTAADTPPEECYYHTYIFEPSDWLLTTCYTYWITNQSKTRGRCPYETPCEWEYDILWADTWKGKLCDLQSREVGVSNFEDLPNWYYHTGSGELLADCPSYYPGYDEDYDLDTYEIRYEDPPGTCSCWTGANPQTWTLMLTCNLCGQ